MKTLIRLLALAAFVCTAAVSHGHEKNTAGPNGGRLLTQVKPHAEFFVTAERKVQITFVGEDGKAVAPGEQVVVVTAGERAAPSTLTFARVGDVLVSEKPLPAGNNFPAVVQIKTTPDAKPVYARFTLNLNRCDECEKPEYACTCAH